MIIRSVVTAAAALTSQIALSQDYSCSFDGIYAVNLDGAEVSGGPIQFGDYENDPVWQFTMTKSEREIIVQWPESPLQFEGTSPAIQTGPSSFAAFFVGRGPCMFTEGHCGAVFHYAEQSDNSVMFHFQPIALTTMPDESRVPLKILAEGTCELTDPNK